MALKRVQDPRQFEWLHYEGSLITAGVLGVHFSALH